MGRYYFLKITSNGLIDNSFIKRAKYEELSFELCMVNIDLQRSVGKIRVLNILITKYKAALLHEIKYRANIIMPTYKLAQMLDFNQKGILTQ